MIWQTVVHLYSRRLFFEKVQWDITTWKKNMQEFRMLLLSERNQSDNVIYMVIATIWYSEEGKTEEAIKRLLIAKEWKAGQWGGRNKWSTEGLNRAVKLSCMVL